MTHMTQYNSKNYEKKLLYRKKLNMTLLGGLSGASLLLYIYDPSLPFKVSKFSKFSTSIYCIYQHTDILFPTRKDLGVLNKQLNYRPRYSNSEIEKREALSLNLSYMTLSFFLTSPRRWIDLL
jgi:hypothetical protein